MLNETQKQEISTWLNEHLAKIGSVRIRIGQTTKAETVSVLTTIQDYKGSGDHEPVYVEKEDLLFHMFSIIDDNGYGDIEPYLRIYAYNDLNKQFSTIQKTSKLNDKTQKSTYDDGGIVESISRVVQPLAQALLKSNQQLINSHEILTNANSHYQETSLRMMEAMIETKEEGIDYINLAMQMKVLLDNNQPQEQQHDYAEEMGDKLINAFGGLMGMGQPQQKQESNSKPSGTPPRSKPTKEEMHAWAKDPTFVMDVAQVFDELQKEEPPTPTQGEDHE